MRSAFGGLALRGDDLVRVVWLGRSFVAGTGVAYSVSAPGVVASRSAANRFVTAFLREATSRFLLKILLLVGC